MPISKSNIKKRLDAWLTMLLEVSGSDLHLKSNSTVHARVKGDIVLLSKEVIDFESMDDLAALLAGDKREGFSKTKEFDGAYTLDRQYRFRVNIYKHLGGLAITLRAIPPVIKSIESLNLPNALHKLTDIRRGLILVTGSTGSGKSTTLASIINEINAKYQYHIITIEDPIEYTYEDNKSIIEQRELGLHTDSFQAALRASLREDPDVIVVGEIRDLKTAQAIIEAADTGHLVFATMHTLDARETVDRLITIFPAEEQNRIRVALSATMKAIISQRLIKSISGEMLPAVEMMFRSPLVQDLIRTKRENEIPDAIEKEGISYDSILFNRALFNLAMEKKITEEQAYRYATNPADLKLMFTLSKEYKNDQVPEIKE